MAPNKRNLVFQPFLFIDIGAESLFIADKNKLVVRKESEITSDLIRPFTLVGNVGLCFAKLPF